ncbi:MAG: GTP pyrophosphokinase [Oscillospiraceae bacterium]|nr:GTP pyrophosphokinase [Oscillospiraceae bacterium]
MLYSDLIRKAVHIAFRAHEGQLDKGGYPYILHPLHVAESMETELETVCALLHDVVEDTPLGFADLRSMGIPEEALGVLRLLTHEEGVPYDAYIEGMRGCTAALRVKRSDLLHNLDATRIGGADTDRREKYERALQRVEGFLAEDDCKKS